jgi:hypothetical protein
VRITSRTAAHRPWACVASGARTPSSAARWCSVLISRLPRSGRSGKASALERTSRRCRSRRRPWSGEHPGRRRRSDALRAIHPPCEHGDPQWLARDEAADQRRGNRPLGLGDEHERDAELHDRESADRRHPTTQRARQRSRPDDHRQHDGGERDPRSRHERRVEPGQGDRDQQVRDTPEDRHEGEQRKVTSSHAGHRKRERRGTETLVRRRSTLPRCGCRPASSALLRGRRRGAALHARGGPAADRPAAAERGDPGSR